MIDHDLLVSITISHSEGPLKFNELCYALAIEMGSPNLGRENLSSVGALLPHGKSPQCKQPVLDYSLVGLRMAT